MFSRTEKRFLIGDRMLRRTATAALFAASAAFATASPRVNVAAAANLIHALDALHAELKQGEPGLEVIVAPGASGSLFAQIKNGAPFDVFLSADTDYPRQLVEANLGDPGTLKTFATGRLVVWTLRPEVDLTSLATAVKDRRVTKIAIAQPRTSPYGRAAQAALECSSVWPAAEPRIVIGESVTQTAQFVESGNADLGLVAMSLVLSPKLAGKGRWIEVPPALYAAVRLDHAVVLTTRGAESDAARRYLAFLASDAARKVLQRFGYEVPAR